MPAAETINQVRAGQKAWWRPCERPRVWLHPGRGEQACTVLSVNREHGTVTVQYLDEGRQPVVCLALIEDLRPREIPGR